MSTDPIASLMMLICPGCDHQAHEPGQCHGGINTTAGSCFCEAGASPPCLDFTIPPVTITFPPAVPLAASNQPSLLTQWPGGLPPWTSGVMIAAVRVVAAWDAKEFDERELCDSLDALKCKLS